MCLSMNRRDFLVSSLAASGVAGLSTLTSGAEDQQPRPTLDLHVHLFGIGEGGTGCKMAKSITDGLQFRILEQMLGVRKMGKTFDEGYERVLAQQVRESGLNKAAILGQDAIYDRHGKADWNRTSFFVPNDYVFAVASRHAETMIPCPSINPSRGDALEELARCHEKGARLFKIHPPTQGVDVGDRRYARFYRRCSELNMLVLVHTGHEHSAPVIDKDLANPRRLEFALDQGCNIVACHSGTGWPSDTPDQLPEFLALLKRYPNLWGDTAVLGTAGRVRDFGRLLDVPLVRSRLLHGSDFPFPIAPAAFAGKISEQVIKRISSETNWIKKDLDLKEAMGIGQISAERAYVVAGINQNQKQGKVENVPVTTPYCTTRQPLLRRLFGR